MASAQSKTDSRERAQARPKRGKGKRRLTVGRNGSSGANVVLGIALLVAGAFVVYWVLEIHARYTLSLQLPVRLRLQWPLVVERRVNSQQANEARLDQGHALTAYQQYTCFKFGDACRVALAIQRAENPSGKCEMYHYNSDGTLDWGYFQINTVHLTSHSTNLRDLLDCRANIDFAYQLYAERENFSAWSTFNSGAYRKFLRRSAKTP